MIHIHRLLEHPNNDYNVYSKVQYRVYILEDVYSIIYGSIRHVRGSVLNM